MCIGQYTSYFASSMTPWTILGPLAFVVGVSLTVEGYADVKRHRSDEETNNTECTILRRSDDMSEDDKRETSINGGRDILVDLSEKPHRVPVAFQKVKRMDIRQGNIILIRNREMVPADAIILASSGENGCAYIETSSIDGETNLKLRNTPPIHSLDETVDISNHDGDDKEKVFQSLERFTKAITRFSALAYPNGISSVDSTRHHNKDERRLHSPGGKKRISRHSKNNVESQQGDMQMIATLVSEPPNAHVHTFSGTLLIPPVEVEEGENCVEIPLGAENILLRGAILRNTEWVLALSCFTGKDTKLVRNSFQTPSKFSRIDILVNKFVVVIIIFMAICIGYLSIMARLVTNERFDELWYVPRPTHAHRSVWRLCV